MPSNNPAEKKPETAKTQKKKDNTIIYILYAALGVALGAYITHSNLYLFIIYLIIALAALAIITFIQDKNKPEKTAPTDSHINK